MMSFQLFRKKLKEYHLKYLIQRSSRPIRNFLERRLGIAGIDLFHGRYNVISMVRLDRIYTRSGDTGETHLAGGQRTQKDSLRVEACGEIDELNSFAGVALTTAEKAGMRIVSESLGHIQQRLFDIGAVLADRSSLGNPVLKPDEITEMEKLIDSLLEGLPPLPSFVLPGGTRLNGDLHVCRTVCRRAERHVLRLSREETVPEDIIAYLNRLSDLFFAMARHASAEAGAAEKLWEPG